MAQVTLQLGGLPVLLSDTAGLRAQTDDPIEVQGMLRAAGEARQAHIQLWVYDAAEPPTTADHLDTEAAIGALEATGADGGGAAAGEEVGADGVGGAAMRLLVLNKVDLLPEPAAAGGGGGGVAPSPLVEERRQWRLSCETGEGVQPFLDALAALVSATYGSSATEGGAAAEPALITRARHREHLRGCVAALRAFEEYADLGECAPLDLAAEEIRIAANELGRITGRIDVEELLDVIFRDFCIGK